MNVIKYPEREDWDRLLKRPVMDVETLRETVRRVLDDVRQNGDQAVKAYEKQFDKVDLDELAVTESEMAEAEKLVSPELKAALELAHDNIHTFHAILRENSDYRLFEDSLRELVAQFRSASIFPLEEPLSQRITQILDQSDADENLMAAIERLQAQYQQRMSAFRHTKKRLADAFPRRLKQARQENITAFFKALEEHRKAFQTSGNQEKMKENSSDQRIDE